MIALDNLLQLTSSGSKSLHFWHCRRSNRKSLVDFENRQNWARKYVENSLILIELNAEFTILSAQVELEESADILNLLSVSHVIPHLFDAMFYRW